jgi:hypothetical protein
MDALDYSSASAACGFCAAGVWWHIVESIPWLNPSGLADIVLQFLQFIFCCVAGSKLPYRRAPHPEAIK